MQCCFVSMKLYLNHDQFRLKLVLPQIIQCRNECTKHFIPFRSDRKAWTYRPFQNKVGIGWCNDKMNLIEMWTVDHSQNRRIKHFIGLNEYFWERFSQSRSYRTCTIHPYALNSCMEFWNSVCLTPQYSLSITQWVCSVYEEMHWPHERLENE